LHARGKNEGLGPALTSVELLNLLAAERDASIFSGVSTNKITVVAALILDPAGRMLAVRKRDTLFSCNLAASWRRAKII
jgi:hypothetical protein